MMRKFVRRAGSILAIGAMGAVLYLFGGDIGRLQLSDPTIWPSLIGALGLYVAVILAGGLAWYLVLRGLSQQLPLAVAMRQLLVSQIAKYLPGNVLHYAGRTSMAVASGVPVRTLGAAFAVEIGATAIAGLATVGALVLAVPEETRPARQKLAALPGVEWLGTILAIAVCAVAAHYIWQRVSPSNVRGGLRYRPLAQALALYTLSFILLGVSLHLVSAIVAPEAPPAITLSVTVFAVAWISGLLTPGAPGGLGVREAVITFGLTPVIGGSSALTVALAHRGVSVLGDVASFGIGLLLSRVVNRPRVGEVTSTPASSQIK